jgi:hypothetical protein
MRRHDRLMRGAVQLGGLEKADVVGPALVMHERIDVPGRRRPLSMRLSMSPRAQASQSLFKVVIGRAATPSMDEYQALSRITWGPNITSYSSEVSKEDAVLELRRHLGEVFRRLAEQKESKIEEGT